MRSIYEVNRDIFRCKNVQKTIDDMVMFLYYEELLNELYYEKEEIMNALFQNT